MKPLIKIYFICLVGLLYACTKSNNNNTTSTSLIGKWKLSETLQDPGDGSGKWMPANTNAFIQFNVSSYNNDSTVTFSGVSNLDIVKFSLVNDSVIIFIYPTSSVSNLYKIQGNELTLTGGCFEACGSKYIKQN